MSVRLIKPSLLTSLFLYVAVISVTRGETWIRQYGLIGSDRVYSLDLTPDGSYIAAGRTTSFNDWSFEDAYLLRIDLHGDTLWTKYYGGIYDERFYSVKTTSDSGYVMAGYTEGTDTLDLDYYIVKADRDGEIIWEKTYGGASVDTAYGICELSGGGYIVVGNTASYGGGGTDIRLLRLNSSGDTLWSKTYGGPKDDYGYSILETGDGGFLISGAAVPEDSTETDLYLLEVDKDGTPQWDKHYGGQWDELGYFLCHTSDGGYAVAGFTFSESMGWSDVWLLRLDSSGDTLWTRKYGGAGKDEGYSVWQCSDSGFIVAGYTMSFGAGQEDFFVIRTDSFGDTIWTRTFGGDGADLAYGARQVEDGGFMIAGRMRSFGLARCDVYLVKTDADGNVSGVAEPLTHSFPPLLLDATALSSICYSLPQGEQGTIGLYDPAGRRIESLPVHGTGSLNLKAGLASGVYFVRLEAGRSTLIRKALVLK